MERLLADAEKLSGQTYSIDNLGDVYEAIHVIQGDLGLTGVAAQEASETFSGSFGAMKASAQNLLGSLAIGENVSGAMQQLITSASTFFFGNFLPMIGTLVKSLPGAIATFLRAGLPLLVSNITSMLSNLATTVTSFASKVTGPKVNTWAKTMLPKVLSAGAKLVMTLARSLITNLPKIVTAVGRIGLAIVKGLGSAIWGKVSAAAAGIRDRFMKPINAMKDKVKGIIDKIKGFFPFSLGKILHFSIPKISISGGSAPWGIGGKGTPPSFSVGWTSHAAGGIFSKRTLMTLGNTVHEFGESGPEAIVPLDPFWKKLEAISAQQSAGAPINIYVNGAGDPIRVAEEVKRLLIKETNQRRLAWQ
jgi:hypothetical protein